MENIKQAIEGRLTDSKDVNSVIITDFTLKKGDRTVVKYILEDNTQYLLVFISLNISYNGSFQTVYEHYFRINEGDLWIPLVDAKNVDAEIFPTFDRSTTDDSDIISLTDPNAPIYHTDNTQDQAIIFDTILNEDGSIKSRTLKTGFMPYYSSLRQGGLGTGIEQGWLSDMRKRFAHKMINQ